MLESITFALAVVGYAGLTATAIATAHGRMPVRWLRVVATVVLLHVALVWHVRYRVEPRPGDTKRLHRVPGVPRRTGGHCDCRRHERKDGPRAHPRVVRSRHARRSRRRVQGRSGRDLPCACHSERVPGRARSRNRPSTVAATIGLVEGGAHFHYPFPISIPRLLMSLPSRLPIPRLPIDGLLDNKTLDRRRKDVVVQRAVESRVAGAARLELHRHVDVPGVAAVVAEQARRRTRESSEADAQCP